MIIHLDSSFRNITAFPFATEFEIQVNSTPPDRLFESDARCLYNTVNYILFSFRWIGDTNNPYINRPDPSDDNKDSLFIKYIPIGPSTALLIEVPPALYGTNNDYFVGLLLVDSSSQMSSIVGAFESSKNVLTLTDPIFETYYDGCGIDDPIPDVLVNTGYLVNTTYWYKTNLLILGSTNLIKTTINEFILAKGLNTDLYVENVSQNWISKIKSFAGPFRSVVLETFPSYHYDDFWIIWQTPYRIRMDVYLPIYVGGVQNWQIIDSSEGFNIGDIVKCNDEKIIFQVTDVCKKGRVLALRLCIPGERLNIGQLIELYNNVEGIVIIRVVDVGIILQYTDLPVSIRTNASSSLITIVDIRHNNVLYYSILYHNDQFMYLDMSVQHAEYLNKCVFDGKFITYFIQFYSFLPNIVAPIVAYQNPICYAVQILSISLPNKPVCGFNIILADFPFVLVTLVNKNSSNGENIGTLISNNPTVSANFVCPIANIRNPDIVKFVVVSSNQVVNFKFTPNNTIFFRVSLPNGDLLKYNTYDNSNITFNACNKSPNNTDFTGCIEPQGIPTFCQQNNFNLNDSVHPNSKIVYAYNFENLVSATFQFDPI